MTDASSTVRPLTGLIPKERPKQVQQAPEEQGKDNNVRRENVKKARETRKSDEVNLSREALNQQEAEETARRTRDKLEESKQALGRAGGFRDEV